MYNLLEIIIFGGILLGYSIGTIVLSLLIQFIVYQLTGFSIYKFIGKKLEKEEIR